MRRPTAVEPRAHHYAPQCWLAGFTEDARQDGRLWVTDFKRRKQWKTSPPNAGHTRDFYRISEPGADPVTVEKFYSKIESLIAPLFKYLAGGKQEPNDNEIEALCTFMALRRLGQLLW